MSATRRLRSTDFFITAALFLFAFGIRELGVRGWLPYVGHPDEPKLVDSAIHIVKSGDLNPHLFIWPSLYTYLEALVVRTHVTWGTLRGYYAGPQSLPDVTHIFSLAPGVYIWVRTFTAIVGALTVALMYVVGRQVFDGNRRIGVIAALLIAVSPLHVEYSHFAITDVPLGFMGLMVLWASYWLARTKYVGVEARQRYDPLLWRSVLAGLLVGVAAGTKYNGVYLLVVPLIAWFIAWRRWRLVSALAGEHVPFVRRYLLPLAAIPISAVAGFLLCEPYLILDWPHFSEGFAFQVRAYLPAQDLGEVWASIVSHFSDLAVSDSHLLLPAALGAIIMLLNPMTRGRAWLLVPFPALYVLAMSRFSLTYVRNMIVTMPFLALMAAYVIDLAVVQIANMVRPYLSRMPRSAFRNLYSVLRWGLVFAAMLFIAWEPLRISWAYSNHMNDPDSRTLAWNWMQERLRAGDRFAAELHPWQVQDWPDVLPFDVERPGARQQLTLRPPDWYAKRGYNYVVLNGDLIDRERDPTNWPLYQKLTEVKHFAGDKEGNKGPIISILATGSQGVQMMQTSSVQVEDFAQLEGYDLVPVTSTGVLVDPAMPPPKSSYKAGEAIGLNLYYRALRDGSAKDPNWQVWIHLIDITTNSTVAQLDVTPLTGLYRNYPYIQQIMHPVAQWHKGELLEGVYNFAIPVNVRPGVYKLETGMWAAPNGPGAKILPDGFIMLGDIDVH